MLSEGASGKDEYTRLQQRYEGSQVPVFFTEDYGIFVDRLADTGMVVAQIEPRFIEVYPPEAALEVESLITNMGKLFNRYENFDPETAAKMGVK